MSAIPIKSTFYGVLVLAVVLTTVACGGSNATTSAPTPVPTPTPTPTPTPSGGADVTITISGFAFTPSLASVRVGQRVAWMNADSTTHTATADNGAFDTGNIAPGTTSAPVMMTSATTLTYHCKIHPFMTASLSVTP
jgi:plastocyanin